MPKTRNLPIAAWDCTELACELVRMGVVESISASTVWQILNDHKLKPWLSHMWLGKKGEADEVFGKKVDNICDLYVRSLAEGEMVLCLDEMTSLQPRVRLQPTRPAGPSRPVQVEHEYKRQGATNVFAALDTRSGMVYSQCHRRKRASEMIKFLEYLDAKIPASITKIHIVLDNLSVHRSKAVAKWVSAHPRFEFHFLPVHCSWLNQVEQWFSILKRKVLRIIDFASLLSLEERLNRYVREYNLRAHPFNWNTTSATRVVAWKERRLISAEHCRYT